MLTGTALFCPSCQTDEYLFATPSKNCTYIECDKGEGGCGRQFVIANDGGDNKVKDNLLIQQLEEPLDGFFAGYFGLQEEEDERMNWTLTAIVSALKKDELEKTLKEKVEAFKKLKSVKKVEYIIKEYNAK